MTTVLCHVIVVFVSSLVTSLVAMKSKTYRVQTDANGRQVCSIDPPTTVIAMEDGTLDGQCGVQCTVSSSCKFYQFKSTLAQCELFNYVPTCTVMADVDQCVAYTDSQPLTLVTSLNETTSVRGIALLNDQLFVIGSGVAEVSVYNTTSFQLSRIITFNGLSAWLYGLATSAVNNHLYIADKFKRIHAVELSVTRNVSVVTWNVPYNPLGLSVASSGNVLVVTNSQSICEYTPNGSLVRNITADNNIGHVIEVTNDLWAFNRRGPLHGIAVMSTNGTVMKSFGTRAGSKLNQMNSPGQLAIDANGNILVADRYNNRILQVNPSLTAARQVTLPIDTALNLPNVVTVEQSRRRLYIGVNGGPNIRILVFGEM